MPHREYPSVKEFPKQRILMLSIMRCWARSSLDSDSRATKSEMKSSRVEISTIYTDVDIRKSYDEGMKVLYLQYFNVQR